jgi:hypothetical protein
MAVRAKMGKAGLTHLDGWWKVGRLKRFAKETHPVRDPGP